MGVVEAGGESTGDKGSGGGKKASLGSPIGVICH